MLPTAVIAALAISVCGRCLQPSAALAGLLWFGRRLVDCSCLFLRLSPVSAMLPTAIVTALAIVVICSGGRAAYR
jgi:hypothetical protein